MSNHNWFCRAFSHWSGRRQNKALCRHSYQPAVIQLEDRCLLSTGSVTLPASPYPVDALTRRLASNPAHGTLYFLDSAFSYAPDPGYSGSDQFTYYLNDGAADSNLGTVYLTVTGINTPPTTSTVFASTNKGVAVSGYLPAYDADGDTVSITLLSGPANGTVTFGASGLPASLGSTAFTYTPNSTFVGNDSFTYIADDGNNLQTNGSVIITVNPPPGPPVAQNDSYNATAGTPLVVSSPGVLSNDTASSGGALTASLVSGPSHGSLTLNTDGSFTYTATTGYQGSDTFTYKANDGTSNSNTATVTITVQTGGSSGGGYSPPLFGGGTTVAVGSTSESANGSGNTSNGSVVPVLTVHQQLVARLYTELLGRSADAGGQAFWSNVLDQGISAFQVALAIQTTTEYRIRVVQDIYHTLLGRAADPAGLQGAVQFLGAGGSREQLEAFVFGSFEYFQSRAGNSNSGFLTAVYHDVLRREIDATGQSAFGAALASGASRTVLAELILSSLEADQIKVQSYYEQILQRTAESAGLHTFVGVLQTGQPDELILALLAGSEENMAR